MPAPLTEMGYGWSGLGPQASCFIYYLFYGSPVMSECDRGWVTLGQVFQCNLTG